MILIHLCMIVYSYMILYSFTIGGLIDISDDIVAKPYHIAPRKLHKRETQSHH